MKTRISAAVSLAVLSAIPLLAHGIGGKDAAFVKQSTGAQIIPFIYLGAKHMVTGYDHLLFLVGVVFFLYRLRDVATYVTCFAIGHSVTLLAGVLSGIHVNPFIVDALIGLSVVYKGFDNLNGFRTLFGVEPNPRLGVLVFGLIHGFGLATKLQQLDLSPKGLIPNMLSFNLGVEIGQILALSIILFLMTQWRKTSGFRRRAVMANVLLMTAGFILMGYQLAGYALGRVA